MRGLIDFECSGHVREEFRRRGCDAWSCDLQPAEDGSRYHIQGDAIAAIRAGCPTDGQPWDLVIAHPPCTFLSSSGLHWNKRRPDRRKKTDAALALVRETITAALAVDARLGLENPTGRIGTAIRPSDQTIHPWQFGHDAEKTTHLWLWNLPLLPIDPRKYVEPRMVCQACGGTYPYQLAFGKGCPHCGAEPGRALPRWSNQTDSGQNRLPPSEHRAADRARTYPGIAAAMAEAWAHLPCRR